MPEKPLIELKNVSYNYQSTLNSGVNSINLEINQGSIISIVGESGSGKSTLLKLIYGLLSPLEGKVSFKGDEILGPLEKLLPGHDQMKMVEQSFNLNTYAKVYENIAALLPNTDLEFKKSKTEEIMQLLNITPLANKRVADLSGGEQQRVAIARALVTDPEVLLLDEPFSQLDTILKTQLRVDIKRLVQQLGITIVMVSHDPVDGMALADRMIILRAGKILETGAPGDIYENPQTLYSARLLGDAVVLTKEEAKEIGEKCHKKYLSYYPQNGVIYNSAFGGKKFVITSIMFKGLSEEILLERNGLFLRVTNFKIGLYSIGQKVKVSLKKTLQFN